MLQILYGLAREKRAKNNWVRDNPGHLAVTVAVWRRVRFRVVYVKLCAVYCGIGVLPVQYGAM